MEHCFVLIYVELLFGASVEEYRYGLEENIWQPLIKHELSSGKQETMRMNLKTASF